jgi:hypothetical protein
LKDGTNFCARYTYEGPEAIFKDEDGRTLAYMPTRFDED